jgi:hypothetical protein
MLKEYLSEAVSLLSEALLGKPLPVAAGCQSFCSTFNPLEPCMSCGHDRRTYVYFTCDSQCNCVATGSCCSWC